MSRLGQQSTHSNGTATKHTTSPVRDEAADTGVLDMSRKATAADFQLEPGTAEEALALLRAENGELRQRLEQNEQLMHAAVASEEIWLERQKEYEVLLEEKSDVIRSLHQKIHDLQESSAGQNLARAEELNQFKEELDARQAQLADDETALVSQMRSMEMALSRERAELARHRNELQRLQADIQHEIEAAARDTGLRDRLATIRARSSNGPVRVAPKTEINLELPPLPPPTAQAPSPPPRAPQQPSATPEAPAAPPQKKVSSGIFRRIFGV